MKERFSLYSNLQLKNEDTSSSCVSTGNYCEEKDRLFRFQTGEIITMHRKKIKIIEHSKTARKTAHERISDK